MFTVVAGIGSILAGLVAIAEIIKLYDESEIPLHVCVASENLESLSKKCEISLISIYSITTHGKLN